MSERNSITRLIDEVKGGGSLASQQLWQRFHHRLIGLAHKKLRNVPRRVANEEDVVAVAFNSFLRGAEAGRFPDLNDRDDLWRLLVKITEHKALHQLEWLMRQKRAGGKEGNLVGESVFAKPHADSNAAGLDQFATSEPTPEFAGLMADEFRRLFEMLADQSLRTVACMKMEGYKNSEIAQRLNCKERTIERKLQLIRRLWSGEE